MRVYIFIMLFGLVQLSFSQPIIDSLSVDKKGNVLMHHKIKCRPGMIKISLQENQDGRSFDGNLIIAGSEIGFTSDMDGNLLIRNVPPGKYDLSIISEAYCRQNTLKVEVLGDRVAYPNIALVKKAPQDTCSRTEIYKIDIKSTRIQCTVPANKSK